MTRSGFANEIAFGKSKRLEHPCVLRLTEPRSDRDVFTARVIVPLRKRFFISCLPGLGTQEPSCTMTATLMPFIRDNFSQVVGPHEPGAVNTLGRGTTTLLLLEGVAVRG